MEDYDDGTTLVAVYRALVENWTTAKTPADLVLIFSKINGGSTANPRPLFNEAKGILKTMKDLRETLYDHLAIIFKSNTTNSYSSHMLITNQESHDESLRRWTRGKLTDTVKALLRDPKSNMGTLFNSDMTIRSQK